MSGRVMFLIGLAMMLAGMFVGDGLSFGARLVIGGVGIIALAGNWRALDALDLLKDRQP